jgi:hypothetical protein
MSQGKRRGDGSKRRHARAGDFRPGHAPRTRPLPLAPGFFREDEAHARGSSDSIEEFVRDTFEKLIDYVGRELDEQKTGAVPARPFDANGQAALSLPATMNFSLKGATAEDNDGGATFLELLTLQQQNPEATFTASSADLLKTLRERTAAIARGADDKVSEHEEAGLLESFALGSFVLVTDTKALIHVRLEMLPPSPFQDHAGNNPATS